jgi:hypothetical protein
VAQIKEKLAMSKQKLHRFNILSFSLNLNEVEGKEQYRVKLPKRFAGLEM